MVLARTGPISYNLEVDVFLVHPKRAPRTIRPPSGYLIGARHPRRYPDYRFLRSLPCARVRTEQTTFPTQAAFDLQLSSLLVVLLQVYGGRSLPMIKWRRKVRAASGRGDVTLFPLVGRGVSSPAEGPSEAQTPSVTVWVGGIFKKFALCTRTHRANNFSPPGRL